MKDENVECNSLRSYYEINLKLEHESIPMQSNTWTQLTEHSTSKRFMYVGLHTYINAYKKGGTAGMSQWKILQKVSTAG